LIYVFLLGSALATLSLGTEFGIRCPYFRTWLFPFWGITIISPCFLRVQHIPKFWSMCDTYTVYKQLAYFPGVARVFIYPNLIVICVTSLAEIAYIDGIFSIITSTLLGGTSPTRWLIYILLYLRTNYSVEYPTVNSFTFHLIR
jgi:hypothetical protein